MVDVHLGTRLEDSIQNAFQSYTAEFKKKAQDERKRYINLVEKSVKDIIKDEVKTRLPQILPKEVSDFATLVIQSTITESLENVVLAKSFSQPVSTFEAVASLIEFKSKKILLKKMQKSKSYRGAPEHRELYDGLIKSCKLDKDLFESYGKTSKDVEPSKGSKSKESKLSSSKGTKCQPKSSGLAYNLLKVTCRSFVELEYNFEECYKAVTDVLDWNNPKGHEYPFDLSKPLPLYEDRGRQVVPVNYFINNDLEYLKGGSSSRKYMTYTTKTKAAKYDDIQGIEDMVPSRIVILKRVEDLQLGVKSYQKKLNITKPETFKSDISNRTPYTAYNNPQGIIYLDKYKRKRMDYLPKRRSSKLDRKTSRIMIKAIDQQLFERRLMWNLEKFVGGRDYGEDFRLLERII
nr:hypothetical protein [Tanacetum cinerariifolium]